jgi:hypothetical protein
MEELRQKRLIPNPGHGVGNGELTFKKGLKMVVGTGFEPVKA